MHYDKRVRKLLILGNGFDLAHKLKTSYTDFIYWYLLDVLKKASNSSSLLHEDHLVKCHVGGNNICEICPEDYGAFLKYIRKNLEIINIKFKNKFLDQITQPLRSESNKWVDIEMQYYKLLKNELNILRPGMDDFEKAFELQKHFEELKDLLNNYISTKIEPLVRGFNKLSNNLLMEHIFDQLTKDDLVLSFNYTSTPEVYKQKCFGDFSIIHIHGKAGEKNNPIIFGFGDEKDSTYSTIENLNENRLMMFIKSFWYLRNQSYNKLSAYIDTPCPFNVEIIGHSCGLSDRTLLSYIFEHENCNKIKIHYYNSYENYQQTAMEISRHFNDKIKMRDKILSFDLCQPCP